MASTQFYHLVDEICQLALIPATAVRHDSPQLSVKGVDFSLRHLDGADEGTVLIHADFGPLPSRQREAILARLLDTNFHLSGSQQHSSFSRDERTDHVVFHGALPLASTRGENVLQLMGHLSEYAQAWRQTYFLDEQPKRPAGARPAARAL